MKLQEILQLPSFFLFFLLIFHLKNYFSLLLLIALIGFYRNVGLHAKMFSLQIVQSTICRF